MMNGFLFYREGELIKRVKLVIQMGEILQGYFGLLMNILKKK